MAPTARALRRKRPARLSAAVVGQRTHRGRRRARTLDRGHQRRTAPRGGHFQQTAVRDVWAFTSSDGRTVALYRIETMRRCCTTSSTRSPRRASSLRVPPERCAKIPKPSPPASLCRRWQLSFQPLADADVEAAASRQRARLHVRRRPRASPPWHCWRSSPAALPASSPAGAAQDRFRRRRVARAAHAARLDARARGRPARGRRARPGKTREYLAAARHRERPAEPPHRELPDVLAARARDAASSCSPPCTPSAIVAAASTRCATACRRAATSASTSAGSSAASWPTPRRSARR